jgi:hypothetical protein
VEIDFLRAFFSSSYLPLMSTLLRELALCRTLNLNLRPKAEDDLLGTSVVSGLLMFGDDEMIDEVMELSVFERLCWTRRRQPGQY